MMIMSDFNGVYEIGPVFRAENSNTPRHLCEFVGLDLEMRISESYWEVMNLIWDLFSYIFTTIPTTHKKEMEAVNSQFPFEPLLLPKERVILTFQEGVQMLKEAGFD